MLEASFKEQETTRITEGEIVEFQEEDNRVLVGRITSYNVCYTKLLREAVYK